MLFFASLSLDNVGNKMIHILSRYSSHTPLVIFRRRTSVPWTFSNPTSSQLENPPSARLPTLKPANTLARVPQNSPSEAPIVPMSMNSLLAISKSWPPQTPASPPSSGRLRSK
ncbi:hypothetical protein BDZ97DRAFT_1824804 [Flammula alnicola]|nr:hypothetical protein BDZ97DRAFT_1824804 [Flammula alnicola]